MKKLREKISLKIKENKFLLKPFLVLILIYLVGISAIILAGVHYADDIGRTERGYAVWANFSRYINEIFSRAVHADNYLTNIAPLPQLLAVVILALSSLILIVSIVGKEKFKQPWSKWILTVIAVIPLGLSPYMLECLSYQYDAVYMALSVFFAVMPVLFRRKSYKYYLPAIIVGTLGVCMTYQAVIGIFPMIMVFLAIKDWSEKKTGFNKTAKKAYYKKLIIAFLVFGLSLIFFQKALMIQRDLYVSNSMPEFKDLIPVTFQHLAEYFRLVLTDFKIIWLVVIGIIVACFVIIFVRNSKRNKIVTTAVIICGTMVMLVFSFIIYSVLSVPLFAPRAMYAVGIFLAILCVYAVGYGKIWVVKLPVFAICWCFFVFAFTYGNALSEQNEYRNTKINMVLADLNDLKIMQKEDMKNIQVAGDIGMSPVIEHMPQDYQMLNRLLKPSFNEGLIWTAYRLVYLNDMKTLKVDSDVDLVSLDLPIIKETVYYDIFGDENNILVEFKN